MVSALLEEGGKISDHINCVKLGAPTLRGIKRVQYAASVESPSSRRKQPTNPENFHFHRTATNAIPFRLQPSASTFKLRPQASGPRHSHPDPPSPSPSTLPSLPISSPLGHRQSPLRYRRVAVNPIPLPTPVTVNPPIPLRPRSRHSPLSPSFPPSLHAPFFLLYLYVYCYPH